MNNNKVSKKSVNQKKNVSPVKGAKKAKRFGIYLYCILAASILFSLLSVSFHGDISLLALPVAFIYTAVTVFFGYFKMLKPKDGTSYFKVLKLIQYLPFVLLLSFILRRAGEFGTSYAYDVITVIVWCVIFVLSLIISNCLNDKHFEVSMTNWNVVPEKKQKPKGVGRILFELVDWVDALIQAVFMVLLIQIFILQLYVIPSESMVPQYLIGDRVAVSKLNCGPKFPLTDIGLNDFTKYKRGDIVVLRNPHYSIDRKSEVKTVVSQLVYMLTFTGVNMNTDENGEPKYDPLVKRITGEAGEQLVMQDGVLYRRTKDSDKFTPAELDNRYAAWNLNAVDPSIRGGIQTVPLTNFQYNEMIDFEKTRRNFDLDAAEIEVKDLTEKFKSLVFTDNLLGAFNQEHMYINKYNGVYVTDLTGTLEQTFLALMNKEGGAEWFENFMTSWIPSKDVEKDMYSESNYRINVMAKVYFGNLAVRYAELTKENLSYNDDAVIQDNLSKLSDLISYVNTLDFRNMPVFPANDEKGNPVYIPEDCYFMMGDNRFNSMDLRHDYDYVQKPLTSYDTSSFEYASLMNPQYINKKLILGKPVMRIWRKKR